MVGISRTVHITDQYFEELYTHDKINTQLLLTQLRLISLEWFPQDNKYRFTNTRVSNIHSSIHQLKLPLNLKLPYKTHSNRLL